MSNPSPPADARERMDRTREGRHPFCVVCGPGNLAGLHLRFFTRPNGGVQAVFGCKRQYQGYPNTLHGGIICALLDGAMTNCLFAHGRTALTAEMTVRFLRPVATERNVIVRAWIEHARHSLYHVAAELRQDGTVVATATAKFLGRKKSTTARRIRSER